MSSAELSAPRGGWLARPRARARVTAPPAPAGLLALLLLLSLWAALDHGAVDEAASARLEVAGALVALVATVAWLWSGSVRGPRGRLARVAVGLLAAFCVWNAISLAWSISPDRTWLEFNRTVLYLLAVTIALACGATWRRAPDALANGLVGLGTIVCAYAIGQKLLPGLHVDGLLNLDQAGAISRLQAPLGYWNALALLLSLIVPLALARAADPGRRPTQRLAHLVLLAVLVLTIALTVSRGGLVALVVALAICVGLGGRPLRSLAWLALGLLAATPSLILALTSHRLTADGVPLAARESAGLVLLALLLVGVLGGVAGALRVIALEDRITPTPAGGRRITRGLLAATAVVLTVAVAGLAVSHRGLTGTVSHAWHSFTATRSASVSQPSRLLSADSANRWVWWKEAAGAFSDRPLGGWGAGSFPSVHLLYRRDTLSVEQAHSVPLQWLAETGLVGALLAGGAIVALLAAGLRAVRGAATGSERAVRAALLAAGGAYAVHCLYDWDWAIPGVTLPALLCLGILAGGERMRRSDETVALPPRPVWLAIAGALLCVTGISAAVPSLAATRAGDAVVAAAAGSAADLSHAAATARVAAELDPVSDAGPRAAAAIDLREGARDRARRELLDAVSRTPTDAQAWAALAYVELVLGRVTDGLHAAYRARALDPMGSFTSSLAAALSSVGFVRSAAPDASATRSETP